MANGNYFSFAALEISRDTEELHQHTLMNSHCKIVWGHDSSNNVSEMKKINVAWRVSSLKEII